MMSNLMKLALIALAYFSSTASACYSDWNELVNDVEASEANGSFVVCPGTVLKPEGIASGGEIFTDIWFYESGIQLLCGEDGKSTNNCVFEGGRSHLYVPDDDIQDIYVSGFQFSGANETSVMLYGSPSSTATFVDCHWSDNIGDEGGAINVWHTYDARGQAQSVSFEKCTFLSNIADDGAVLIEGGNIELKQCQFGNNLGGWALELQLDATAKLYDNCFTNNQGPVFIYPGSSIEEQVDNFASNNDLDDYNCEGAWDDYGDLCIYFTAPECQSDRNSSSSYITNSVGFVSLISIMISFVLMA